MATFALVHGAWHGAWCWEVVVPLLRDAGHDVVAVDLPCDDGTAGFDVYADVVCDALGGSGDDVVLVGHSLAGNTIPLVADRRPVMHLVYLCAVVPDIGRSLFDQLATEMMLDPAYTKGLSRPDELNRTTWVDLELAHELFLADCDARTSAAALGRLRPQARFPFSVPFPLPEFPAVPCTSVICTEDRLVLPDWSRRVAKDRLDADVVELPGSHSPFYSRPSDVVDILLRTVEN